MGDDQEFATLKPHNVIFKLVGPILVPQEQSEAKLNVDTRLDFIRGEMCAVIIFLGLFRDQPNLHSKEANRDPN